MGDVSFSELQKKLNKAASLEDICSIMDEAASQNDVDIIDLYLEDLDYPRFGEEIPIDLDMWDYDKASSMGYNPDEMAILSWDSERILVYCDNTLTILVIDDVLDMADGYICPFCNVFQVNHGACCNHLIWRDNDDCIDWFNDKAEQLFVAEIKELADQSELDEEESSLDGNFSRGWEDIDSLVYRAMYALFPNLQIVEDRYSGPHGHGSWVFYGCFVPDSDLKLLGLL